MICVGDEDEALRMRWALVCSVPDDTILNTLSDFACWFLLEVSKAANKMSLYERFEERPRVVLQVPINDFDACDSAYDSIRKKCFAVMLVVHILPRKNAPEHKWMRALSSVYGFIRQGVLLENALDRFAGVMKNMDDACEIYREIKPYDLRIGTGTPVSNNLRFDPVAVQAAVHTVLAPPQNSPLIHSEEAAVWVSGFSPSLNNFGVAQLFHGLTVTGVSFDYDSAVVTFATKFLALQACALDSKRLDRVHTLRVEPLSLEVLEQLPLTVLRK